ncbi:MAG: hypothetical protein GYA33_06320 [Thermogutta sp.]|nr:hypothetical protein [Thermogutta sp.]
MTTTAVALISGGLDGLLAARIVQSQGIEVVGLHVRIPVYPHTARAFRGAAALGIPLAARAIRDDYIDLLRAPKQGFGRGANPCLDCRAYMLRLAKELMEEIGAAFLITGEVLGQRPFAQRRRDLLIVAHMAGLQDRVLRPLSAKRLPPTVMEQQGLVDRSRLYDLAGRSRRPLRALAEIYGLRFVPEAAGGCALTEKLVAPRVWDLVDHDSSAGVWDLRLLTVGRHFRIDKETKLVLGRNALENNALRRLFEAAPREKKSLRLVPKNFRGPEGLLIGSTDEIALAKAIALLCRYAKKDLPGRLQFDVVFQQPSLNNTVTINRDPRSWPDVRPL